MNELESSRHLFQRPLYRDPRGRWTDDFNRALQACGDEVHLDIAAVASYLSFGLVCQDRTMLREITRRPWLSRVTPEGQVVKEPIPPHGFQTGSDDEIAKRFHQLLCDEALAVCAGFKEIYILLSGGLDSRIIAGVLSQLYEVGDIPTKPIAVTWGLPDSRDVVYASQVAKTLGFEWRNIEIRPETVLDNIEATARTLGLMHSPEMLHNMLWFKNVPSTSLVIAGSFGDSIGRAEFSGEHLLQLERKAPTNTYQLMKPGTFRAACVGLNQDLEAIHTRAQGNVPPYAPNEHWMQGCRMRGGLCHALSIINRHANLYQMFTAPPVYEYMWSLHPARRDNNIYAALLEREFPRLARVPWPRTNRALHGKTAGAQRKLRLHYHEYTKWSAEPLNDELTKRIDPDWFAATGVFEPSSIRKLNDLVRASQVRVGRLNDIWLWLAGLRAFAEYLESNGMRLVIEAGEVDSAPRVNRGEANEVAPQTDDFIPQNLTHLLQLAAAKKFKLRKAGVLAASKSQSVNSILKALRGCHRSANLKRLKRTALREYPPGCADGPS